MVLVTGARQVGKTTMLQHLLPGDFRYVTLDDPRAGVLAREDPALFFDANRLPVAVDEVQRVPGLFQQVKFLVDQSPEMGRVVLTGSPDLPPHAGRQRVSRGGGSRSWR